MTKDSIAEKFILTAAAEVITLQARRDALAMVLDAFQAVMSNLPKVELTELDHAAIEQHTHYENCAERFEGCKLCYMEPQEWLEHWQRAEAEEDLA